ncbi:poly(R)-hydroxyalkanoic acid synthase subunit PhaE [Pokkaliibacter sp. CJK22405]|uniref:poly(R)-hydroxyalkanoic acid synthase subunit PhaE n=1 Tax=Pokkaliibacter sp. CJK22405 TaxID=3384615 RepID=UPI0039851B6C
MEANPFFGLDKWIEAQQEYWQKLAENTTSAGYQTPPWQGFMDNWKTFAGQTFNGQSRDAFQDMSKQTEWFTSIGEEMLKSWQNFQPQMGSETLLKQFSSLMQKQVIDNLLKEYALPEQFTALFKTHSFQDDLLFDNAFMTGLKSQLDMPSVGSNREFQEKIQHGSRLWLDFQESFTRYAELYGSINADTTKLMLEKLDQEEVEVTSLGELHDLWVDCYEQCYQKLVFTDDYRHAHGRLSNAFMAIRKYNIDMRDMQLKTLGMPTRLEMNTALKRQHDARKELRTVHRHLSAMQEEISELRKQVKDQAALLEKQAKPANSEAATKSTSSSTASSRKTTSATPKSSSGSTRRRTTKSTSGTTPKA